MSGVFVIAEAGVNHNGDKDLALRLVEIAAKAGADAVKFQTFSADKLVRRGAAKADYQRRETGEGDQHSMLRQLELSEEMHRELLARCEEVGIEFMSTPFDEEAADFLVDMGMRRLKIPSGEITNHPFLAHLASKNLPMILSTGMATLADIAEAVQVIASTREKFGFGGPLNQVLTVLHCTSNYPTALSDVNLRSMNTIAEATGLPVGYSDHTEGISVSFAAVAMGATVLEKHFTLDKSLPGPDHRASLEPAELEAMIIGVREAELILGSPVKQPTASELPVRDLVRRSVTLIRDVPAGHVLMREDLSLLRPGDGIAPKDMASIIQRRTAVELLAGTTLQWKHLA